MGGAFACRFLARPAGPLQLLSNDAQRSCGQTSESDQGNFASVVLRRDRRPSCSWAQGSWVLAEPFVVESSAASVQVPNRARPSPGRKAREVWFCLPSLFFAASFALFIFLPLATP